MMKRQNLFLILWSLLIFQSCHSQTAFKAKTDYPLTIFESEGVLRSAHYAISIRSLENNEELVSINSKDYMVPASNLKILYTLAAVDKYGENYKYNTLLYRSGDIKEGVLEGDLVFQSFGDPSFASLRFYEDLNKILDSIVNSIKKQGIKKIKGKLVFELNGWRYPAAGSWPIEDIGNYYGTGAWDFNFRDNRLDIYVQRSDKEGDSVRVLYTVPHIPGITYISKIKTAAPDTGDEAYIYAAPFDKTRYIMGTIPAGKGVYRIKAGMPNPPLSFLQILNKKLEDEGIQTQGTDLRYIQQGHKFLVWSKESPALIDIAKITNDYSMNHFSEALGWLLIQKDQPADGYLQKDSINRFFEVQYGLKKIDLEDASGLAPDNLIAPSDLSLFLANMVHKLSLKKVLDILPQGGKDGYAKYFLRKSPVQNRVWVKSGSVSKVRNYSGIFQADSGRYYSFSVMTNFFKGTHAQASKAIEKLVEAYIHKL
jgi:D-alanyl-D-alanine carboxypeptidase/D-alanyl-D-alanine-endopeptidase (penicillin-binding protein 4)